MHCCGRLWHSALEEQRGCKKIHYLKFLFLFLTRFHAALFLSSCSFFSPSIVLRILCLTVLFYSWLCPFCYLVSASMGSPNPLFLILCVLSPIFLFRFAVVCLAFLSLSVLLSNIIQKKKSLFVCILLHGVT